MRHWTMRHIARFIGIYLGLSLILGLTWLLLAYPDYPMSAAQWILVFLLILPAQLILGLLASRLWNNRAIHFIEERTREKSFSMLRVGYGIVYFLLLIVLLFAAGYLWLHVRLPLD